MQRSEVQLRETEFFLQNSVSSDLSESSERDLYNFLTRANSV